MQEAPPDVVLSTHWVPPLTGLRLQAEVALRCPAALRLMFLTKRELNAALTLADEGQPLRFLARPWGEKTLPALLWRFVSDQRFLQLVSDVPVQGLSVEALCHEARVGRFGSLPRAPPPEPSSRAAAAIVGGTLLRRGASTRLVTDLGDERRLVVDVPCRRADHSRIAA